MLKTLILSALTAFAVATLSTNPWITDAPIQISPINILDCFRSSVSPNADLLFPGDPNYFAARRADNARSLDWNPLTIVNVTSNLDVKASLLCANKLGVKVGVMAGGHGYEIGYGTNGILLFMNYLNNLVDVKLVPETTTQLGDPDYMIKAQSYITVQAGTRNAKLHGMLLQQGLYTPQGPVWLISGGTFFDVGVAGHSMCGGFGNFGRTIGLMSDQVIGYTVMTSAGEELIVNSTLNSDLFFALRGACSSSIVVVLTITLRPTYWPLNAITSIGFTAPAGTEALAMVWASNYGSFADDRLTVVYNLFKGGCGGRWMGTAAEAIAMTYAVPGGFQELETLLGYPPTDPLTGLPSYLAVFREYTVFNNIVQEFGNSAQYRGAVQTSLVDLLNTQSQGVTGTRYFMFDLVFSEPMPIECGNLLMNFFHSGQIGNFGFKSRNGINSKQLPTKELYTDDKWGPMLRGMLYEIHIGTTSPSEAQDTQTIANLLALKDQLRPYLYGDGEAAYMGYAFFGNYTQPSGRNYYGDANVYKLQQIREKYDPANTLSSRTGENLYPVCSDKTYGQYAIGCPAGSNPGNSASNPLSAQLSENSVGSSSPGFITIASWIFSFTFIVNKNFN